jgi:nicotinate-nucleotide adenylyltransferase
MTVAILGGTFNPVHLGHLNIAREVQTRLGYDCIVFVPANSPAHKQIASDVGAGHRLAMLKLAVSSHPQFCIDECELRRGGTSYTIDTVRDIRNRYDLDGKPGLIIGDDLVEDFKSWKHVDRLVAMVDLIIAHRESPEKVEIQYSARYIDNSLYPISSSEIRERLRRGKPVNGSVPPEVLRYIERHGLYY